MIDKIYMKDRRMVNNMYKGNMLSTAVLNDIHRYHKLKSSTGVESKFYDDMWLADRIEEEKQEIGLSLDCAPNPGPVSLEPNANTPLIGRANLSAAEGASGSVTVHSGQHLAPGASTTRNGPIAEESKTTPPPQGSINKAEASTSG